jgi:hypothetical protein
MKRISSSWTFFYKRVFPAMWFGFLLLFIMLPLFGLFGFPHSGRAPPVALFIVPVVMMIFGYFVMRKLVFDLVDQVWDDGDSLLVRNRGEEQRVALADIKNVSYTQFMNPPRVVLSLRRTTAFGDQIAFCAPLRFMLFSSSPVISDLIDRIDAARQKPA